MPNESSPLAALNSRIVACEHCSRLRSYCAEVARVRRRAYAIGSTGAKPVPSFGDPKARVMALGLAPGAHGSNRTGRPLRGRVRGFSVPCSACGWVCVPGESYFARRWHEAHGPLDQRGGALRSARQQACTRGTAQLRSMAGRGDWFAHEPACCGLPGQDCVLTACWLTRCAPGR